MEKLDLESVYVTYQPKVAGYIHFRINNPQDAEDLVSQVFLKVSAHADSFDPEKASVSTWIYTITANTVKDFYKQRRDFCELSEADGVAVPEEEDLSDLADALQRLSQRERDVIVLHYYTGYSLKEVAQRMSLSYATIKLAHSDALKKLQRILSPALQLV